MATASLSLAAADRGLVRRILTAGTVVAILDIGYVTVLWVVVRHATTFERILQSIASGLLGRAAYDGGTPTALLGAVLHWSIGCIWSALFAIAVRSWAPLGRRLASAKGLVSLGLAYGGFVWLAMDLVVLPLSRARMTPVASWVFAANFVQHTIMVGLPIALIVGRAFTPALAAVQASAGVVRVRRHGG